MMLKMATACLRLSCPATAGQIRLADKNPGGVTH